MLSAEKVPEAHCTHQAQSQYELHLEEVRVVQLLGVFFGTGEVGKIKAFSKEKERCNCLTKLEYHEVKGFFINELTSPKG